jgi:hypothetical protein
MKTNSSRCRKSNEPRLRWYQWTLRSLFVLGLFVAIAMSFVATMMQDQRAQGLAADAIKKAGGIPGCEVSWLGRLLHDDSLVNVGSVALSGNAVNGAALNQLRQLRHLQTLLLQGDAVTDRDLAYLDEVPRLKRLWLDGTRVTDAGLVHLRSLRQLEFLFLNNTEVTDTTLAQLEGLKHLVLLDVTNTKVTDEGVRALHQELPHCAIKSNSGMLWPGTKRR